jgi:hypothetical protein
MVKEAKNQRKFDGEIFTRTDHCIENKLIAKQKANQYKDKDIKVRVIKDKCGYSIFTRIVE